MPFNWAEKLKTSFSDIRILWALCLVFNIITFLFIFFKIRPSGKTLALHYNVLVGVEWYGKGNNLFLIPAVGLAILAVNFTLYRTLRRGKFFLPVLTVFVSLCVQIILLAAVLFLATVN